MVIDHIGVEFFPQYNIFRIIGRQAFPIFAYFIFEGVYYAHDKLKYFLRIFVLGILCGVGYYVYAGEIYGKVLITFSLSLLILFSVQLLKEGSEKRKYLLMTGFFLSCASIIFAYMVCSMIYIDYGLVGVLLPVFAELTNISGAGQKEKIHKWYPLVGFFIGSILLAVRMGGNQYFAILALLLLTAADEHKNKHRIKQFFYLFYPVHLMIIGGLSMVLSLL